MIVDMHVHLSDRRVYSENWNNCIKENLAKELLKTTGIHASDQLIDCYIKTRLADYDCSRLISNMNQCGIEKSCVLFIDFGDDKDYEHTGIQEVIQIHLDALKANRERFEVFMGVHPSRGKEGVQLFEKCIWEYGFCGMKLYPPCGYEIDDADLYPYYEICNHYRLPVLIHIGPSWPSMKSVFAYPNSILKVASEFKEISFILGHAAILFYEDSVELPNQRENIYLEVSGYRKMIHSQDLIKKRFTKLVHRYPNKIVFGSDYPMYAQPQEDIEYFKNFNVLDEEKTNLFYYKNALDILSRRRILSE